MKVILSTAYWPNLHYFFYFLNAEEVQLEQFENYGKQSFRNRTQILSANGVLDLSIPVKKKEIKELIKNIEISYQENWQINHWRAITSAYKNSPYFEYFEDAIKTFYFNKYEFLFDFNLKQLETILKLIKQKKEIKLTSEYLKEHKNYLDLREKIHPKIDFKEDGLIAKVLEQPYYQTFESKFSFNPNLSVLDLLFNVGLETLDYLKK